MRSRALWTLLDQVLSSVANAALSVVVARTVSDVGFGAFSLAFSLYALIIALNQGLNAQPFAVHYSGAEEQPRRAAASLAAGGSLLVGAVSGIVVLTGSLAADGVARPTLIAMAVLLPALTLQDTWRSIFIARGTPRQAFTNDLVWVVLQIVSLGGLIALGAGSAVFFIIAWSASALIAALWGVRQSGCLPHVVHLRRWFGDHRDVTVPATGASLATLGSTQIALLSLAAIAGIGAVGSIRGAQTLVGPLNLLQMATIAFVVAELARSGRTAKYLWRAAGAVSGLLVAGTAALGAGLLLIPQQVGEQILGASWTGTREALPFVVLFTLLNAATVGPVCVMRAMNRGKPAFWVSMTLGLLLLPGAVVGSFLGAAPGAAAGLALAAATCVPLSWLLLRGSIRSGYRPMLSAR